MGMFDNIKVKTKLPLNKDLKKLKIKWSDVTFQTKDLDNCLGNYIITKDGKLIEDIIEYDYVYFTEEEKKSKDHRPWNIIKDSKVKDHYQKTLDFHGKIMFYETFEASDKEDVWVDFEAYFIYGKLDKIELVKVEKQQSRKIQTNKWFEEDKLKRSKPSYKLKTRLGYFWILGKAARSCSRIARMFNELQTFCIRRMNT